MIDQGRPTSTAPPFDVNAIKAKGVPLPKSTRRDGVKCLKNRLYQVNKLVPSCDRNNETVILALRPTQ